MTLKHYTSVSVHQHIKWRRDSCDSKQNQYSYSSICNSLTFDAKILTRGSWLPSCATPCLGATSAQVRSENKDITKASINKAGLWCYTKTLRHDHKKSRNLVSKSLLKQPGTVLFVKVKTQKTSHPIAILVVRNHLVIVVATLFIVNDHLPLQTIKYRIDSSC